MSGQAVRAIPTFAERFASRPYTNLPDKPVCATFNTGKWSFYLDALFSPDIALRSLEPRTVRDGAYVNTREATESPLFSYSLSLRASVLSPVGIALRTGVNYSQVNEKFDFIDKTSETITITTIYNPEGEVIGTDTVVSASEVRQVSHNNYRMLDIPIILGYEYRHRRWTFGLQGGTYINLLFAPKGDFLSPNMEPVTFTPGASNAYRVFRDRIGLGWYGGLSVSYHLNPRLQLLVEPHVKMYPRPATIDQYQAEQRYTSIGLFMGVRHQL